MNSPAELPVKAEKFGLSPPEMTQGSSDGIHGIVDTQAFGIDDNVIIQGILDVRVEVFFYKCLSIRFRFQNPGPGFGSGRPKCLGYISDSRFQGGNHSEADSFFRRQNEIGASPDDNGPAVFADGADDLHEVLEIPVRPQVPLVYQGGYPLFEDGRSFFVEGFQKADADVGTFSHFVDEFLIKQIEFELLGKTFGQYVSTTSRFSGDGNHRNTFIGFFLFRSYNLPSSDLFFYDLFDGPCFGLHDPSFLSAPPIIHHYDICPPTTVSRKEKGRKSGPEQRHLNPNREIRRCFAEPKSNALTLKSGRVPFDMRTALAYID